MGVGAPVVMLPGFALSPEVYRPTATLLAEHCRVIVPDVRIGTAWRYEDVQQRLTATLDRLELDKVTFIGHSFAGSVELGFAARHPERIVELVFADTLAISREIPLAKEALRHPIRLLWLATPRCRRVLRHHRAHAPATGGRGRVVRVHERAHRGRPKRRGRRSAGATCCGRAAIHCCRDTTGRRSRAT